MKRSWRSAGGRDRAVGPSPPPPGELWWRQLTAAMGRGKRRGAGCHRRGTAIVPPLPAAPRLPAQGHAGLGAAGDNVPVEAGGADGDKRRRCSARQRLNASSVLLRWVGSRRLGVAAGTQELARPCRGSRAVPGRSPASLPQRPSSLPLLPHPQASDTGSGPRKCHNHCG